MCGIPYHLQQNYDPPFLCPCPFCLLVRVVATFEKRPTLLSVQLCVCVFFFSFIRSTIASFDVGWRQALSRGATVLAAKEFFERNY